jgi:hypothetical protein
MRFLAQEANDDVWVNRPIELTGCIARNQNYYD